MYYNVIRGENMKKVIFHVDEIEKWPMNLTNLENLMVAYEKETSEVRILANGPAVQSLVKNDSEISTRMRALNEQGVVFVACNNALNMFDIKKEDIFDFVEVVPAGVVELIDRQAEGFAYIRP